MIQIAIILGSTRPGRRVADVGRWVAEAAGRHLDFTESDAGVCAPGERQEALLTLMLDEVLEWSRALQPLHSKLFEKEPG